MVCLHEPTHVTDGTESTQTQVRAGKTADPEQKCENLCVILSEKIGKSMQGMSVLLLKTTCESTVISCQKLTFNKGTGIHWTEDESWSNKNLTYGLIKRINQLIKGLPRS